MRQLYSFISTLVLVTIGLSTSVSAQIAVVPKTTLTCPTQKAELVCNFAAGSQGNITSDDIFGGIINIGFPFEYYGQSYTQCVVSANGYVTFDLNWANQWSSFVYPTALGNGQLNNAIMFPFQDINPNGRPGNSISYITYGSPGKRVFIVQFCKLPLFNCPTLIVTTQLILHEENNKIEINLIEKPSGCSWELGTGIVGLRNGTNQHLVPGKDIPNTQWAAYNQTYTYEPLTATTYKLDSTNYNPYPIIINPDTNRIFWYAQGDTINPVGTGKHYTAYPDGNIRYYVAKYFGPGVCYTNDTFTFYDTAYINYNNFYGTTNVEICAGETYDYFGETIYQTGRYEKQLVSYQGCDSFLTLNLLVNPLPDVTTTNQQSILNICDGLSTKVGIKSPLSTTSYQWYRNGEKFGVPNVGIEIFEEGIYHVIGTTNKGCIKQSESFTVIVNPNPVAEMIQIGNDVIGCTFDTITIVAKQGNLYEYNWWPEYPFRDVNYNLSSPVIQGIFRDPITDISLLVRNEYGCVDTTSFQVKSVPCCEIFTPNAFTPNNDGLNDLFLPQLQPGQKIVSLEIYSKLGQQVYNYNIGSKGWDGNYPNGKAAALDVYMYQLIYSCDDGKNYTKKDGVTLMR